MQHLLNRMPHLSPALATGHILMQNFMDALFCQVGGWAGAWVAGSSFQKPEAKGGGWGGWVGAIPDAAAAVLLGGVSYIAIEPPGWATGCRSG
jgi:hypothetical protein